MLYVALPVHWEEFGLTSLWQAGVLLSVNRLVRLPLNPAVSRLYRRISARSGMLLAAVLAAATTAGYGLAGSFAALIVLRALWGLAWTFLRLGAYFTVLTTADDSSQGRAMGMYNGLMRTGSLFGMLLGGVLADTWGTGLTCAFFASVSVLAVPLIWFAVPRNAKGMAEEASAGEDGYSLFSHRKVLSVLLIGTAVAFVYQGMLISTLSYLVKIRIPAGLDLGWALVGAASLGGVLQAVRWSWEPFLAPFFGWLSDHPRAGRKKTFIVSSLIGAALFAFLPADMGLLPWLLLLLLLQVTATALTTAGDAVAADTAVRSGAKIKVITAYSVLTDVGAAAGPAAAFALNQYSSPWASCRLASLLLLLAAAGYFFVSRRG